MKISGIDNLSVYSKNPFEKGNPSNNSKVEKGNNKDNFIKDEIDYKGSNNRNKNKVEKETQDEITQIQITLSSIDSFSDIVKALKEVARNPEINKKGNVKFSDLLKDAKKELSKLDENIGDPNFTNQLNDVVEQVIHSHFPELNNRDKDHPTQDEQGLPVNSNTSFEDLSDGGIEIIKNDQNPNDLEVPESNQDNNHEEKISENEMTESNNNETPIKQDNPLEDLLDGVIDLVDKNESIKDGAADGDSKGGLVGEILDEVTEIVDEVTDIVDEVTDIVEGVTDIVDQILAPIQEKREELKEQENSLIQLWHERNDGLSVDLKEERDLFFVRRKLDYQEILSDIKKEMLKEVNSYLLHQYNLNERKNIVNLLL